MDEFEVLTSLYTPGSDLALGDVTNADAEATFGRAGNDLLRTYSPQAASQRQNVDYLFGDLFDNSQEELEVFFNIQNRSNPLGILDIDLPSVGADRFILGDVNIPYYDDDISGASSNDFLSESFGLNDYSVIYDFNPEQDIIQLNGSPDDYLLVEINNLNVGAIQQPFSGEAIFLRKEDRLDLVSYIVSTPEVNLDLNDDNFEYVDGAAPPSLEQAGQIGSPGVDVSYGSATDSEGNVYLTGTTSGSLGGDSQGGFDVWVAKYNRQGQELWRQQFGTSGNDRAYGIEVDGDGNFYLTGQTNSSLFGALQSSGSDAWVAKFNGDNGQIIWGRQYGANLTNGVGNSSFDLAVDDRSNVYVSGLAIKSSEVPREVFDFDIQDDSFVVKFDTDGNQQWFSDFGNIFFDESFGIDVDDEGNVYATGWTQGLNGEADPSRNLLKYDYWLSRLNANSGEVESIQQFNSSNEGLEFAWDVETDSQGNAVVSGWTTGNIAGSDGSYDPLLAKYNPDGTLQWVRQFGTSGDDGLFLASFDIDSQDNIYVTGYTNSDFGGSNQGDYDTWVVKYDPQGNQQWTQQLGTTNREYGTDVVANEFGEVFVTGFTNGSLGSANAGAEDVWVARLSADSGSVESFADDAQGSIGAIGQEPEGQANIPNNGQLSEEAITESLDEVFAPDEEFTDSLGESLDENSDELIFEDETGSELDESEIDEIEGVGDDNIADNNDVLTLLDEETNELVDTSGEANDNSIAADGDSIAVENLSMAEEEDPNELIFEDETGSEIDEIEGFEDDNTSDDNDD